MEREARNFITGRGEYVDDLRLEGMLYLGILRSPYARARISDVKGNGARTGTEFRANLGAVGEGAWGGGRVSVPYPALASEYVSYEGQPVAAVLADDQYKSEDRTEEINVEFHDQMPNYCNLDMRSLNKWRLEKSSSRISPVRDRGAFTGDPF